jgi:hypothetical protein
MDPAGRDNRGWFQVTIVDRLLVAFARAAIRLVGLRFNQGRGRVFIFNTATNRPYRLPSGQLAPLAPTAS